MNFAHTCLNVALALLVVGCGSSSTPATIPDAGADGPTDAQDASDNVPDAAADAPSSSFCASAGSHFFCDDFDVSADPAATWTSSSLAGGALLTLDTGSKVSAPASGRATLPAAAAGNDGAHAYLHKDVPAGHVVVDAKVRIEPGSLSSTAFVAYLTVESATARFVLLRADQMYVSFGVTSIPVVVPVKVAMALDTFVHVVLDVDFTQAQGSYTLTLDDNFAASGTLPSAVASTSCTVTAGIGCTSPAACDTAGVDYDDFIIDTK
jgi:hypothetical protein